MAGRAEIWKGGDLLCVLVSTVEFREFAQIVEHMNLQCIDWTEGGIRLRGKTQNARP